MSTKVVLGIYSLSMPIKVVLGVIILWFVYILKSFIKDSWRLRNFRGPLALPMIGNCYNLSIFTGLIKFLAETRKSYGKLFKVFIMDHAYLVVLDPTVIRRVLSDPKAFPKGADYSNKFSIIFGEGLVTSGNEKHRHDKGVFGKYFIRSNISKLLPMINEMALEAIDQYITTPMGKNDVLPVNCESLFARLALRIFMKFSINFDYRHDLHREEEICHIVSRASYNIAMIIAFNVPNWDWLPPVKTSKLARSEVWKDIKPVYEDRIKKMRNGELTEEECDDCLTAIIKNDMQEKDVIDHIVTLICAGHDTTAFFSSYLVIMLAENQDCQTRLREVIEKQMGDRLHVTGDDIAEMKYMQQFMHETLRMFAVIPNLSRVAVNDTVIKEANDLFIPAGTEILIPMSIINRDPTIWENPTKFDPTRWEGKGDYTSAKDGFFPFGYGSRTCIGNMLAQYEALVNIVQILRKFDVLPQPGFKVNVLSGISLTTSNGVKVIFRKRG
jgi:cytochrome P450